MNKPDGGPAFPKSAHVSAIEGNYTSIPPTADGMTLRDYFAAQTLVGIKSDDELLNQIMDVMSPPNHQEAIAIRAYTIADAMLAQRDSGTLSPTEAAHHGYGG